MSRRAKTINPTNQKISKIPIAWNSNSKVLLISTCIASALVPFKSGHTGILSVMKIWPLCNLICKSEGVLVSHCCHSWGERVNLTYDVIGKKNTLSCCQLVANKWLTNDYGYIWRVTVCKVISSLLFPKTHCKKRCFTRFCNSIQR